MSEINSTQTVSTTIPTGYVQTTEVGTVSSGNGASTSSVQAGGGYFVMPSLVSMGLLAPTGPKDIHAYAAAFWIEVDAAIDEIEKQGQVAGHELLRGLLAQYGWLLTTADSEYGTMISEREASIETYNSQLTTLIDERTELVEQRAELVEQISEETSSTVRAALQAELNQLDVQLTGLIESIDSIDGEVALLLEEIADIEDSLSQVDTAFLILLTAIVRQYSPVDNELQSSENIQVQRNEEKVALFRDQAFELNLSQYRGEQRLEALKQMEIQLQTDSELLVNLKLTAMKLIQEKLPPEPNGGILQDPTNFSGNGERFRLQI